MDEPGTGTIDAARRPGRPYCGQAPGSRSRHSADWPRPRTSTARPSPAPGGPKAS